MRDGWVEEDKIRWEERLVEKDKMREVERSGLDPPPLHQNPQHSYIDKTNDQLNRLPLTSYLMMWPQGDVALSDLTSTDVASSDLASVYVASYDLAIGAFLSFF